jgi:hypothetical protein
MTNTYDQITKEFNSLTNLFEEKKSQDIKTIIQDNLANYLYNKFTEEISLVLVLASCSVVHIKVSSYGDLSISLYHECTGSTPFIYRTDISNKSKLFINLFSSYGDDQIINTASDDL